MSDDEVTDGDVPAGKAVALAGDADMDEDGAALGDAPAGEAEARRAERRNRNATLREERRAQRRAVRDMDRVRTERPGNPRGGSAAPKAEAVGAAGGDDWNDARAVADDERDLDDDDALDGDAPARGAKGFPPVDTDPSALGQRFYEIDRRLSRLGKQQRAFRERIFAIQTTVVEGMGRTHCALGDPGAEIFPVETRLSPESPVRVIAFGSMGTAFGLPPKQFFQALGQHDCEIVFLKDFRQCWYQKGLLGLTSSVEETADFLRRMIESDGRPVSMVGASSGGFAAILFGCLLGARKVVAFSPQTRVTRRVFGKFRTEDSRIEDMDFDAAHTDLRRVAEEHSPRGRIDLYYSTGSAYDTEQALHMDGIDNVRLRGLDWHGHNTAGHLKGEGRLDAIMADLASPDL